MRRRGKLELLVFSAMVFAGGRTAWSQPASSSDAASNTGDASTQGVSQNSSPATVGEIVVTAQKRAQNLQNVPVAVTALTGAEITQRGITNAAALSQFVPSLSVSEAGGGTILPFLRGVGNPAGEVGNESSVALYLDDVYVSRLDASFLELADVSRIEILNGPQGTLFGRNASAGVLNIVTKDPSATPEGSLTLGYGNFNTSTEKLYISGPLASNIRANLSLVNTNQADGWGKNLAGDRIGFLSPFVVRSKVLINLTPFTTLRLEADYNTSKGNEGLPSNTVPSTSTGSPDFYALPPYNRTPIKYTNLASFYDEPSFGPDIVKKHSFGTSVRLDQDLAFAKLSSITAYRQEREDQQLGGFSPDPDGFTELNSQSRTLTEELQLTSKPSSPFDWIVGFFYLNEFSAYDPTRLVGPSLAIDDLGGAFGQTLPPASELDLYSQERVKEYAIFTQETFHLPLKVNLTTGFRYTIDDLDAQGRTAAIIPDLFTGDFPGATDTSSSFRKPTFKVGLDRKFGTDVLGYVSVSRGVKAGTYNLLPLTLPPTRPEVLTDYELGAKSTFFSRRLLLDGAIFYYDYVDPQVSEVQDNLLFLANARSAHVKGAELQGQYVVSPEFRVRFGLNLLDAKYSSFPGAPDYQANPAPPYGVLLSSIDARGRDLPFAPDVKANVGVTYTLKTPYGGFIADGNYTYNGGFAYTADNVLRQGAFSLLDAAITYTPPNNPNIAIRGYARNLTGSEYSYGDLEVQGYVGFEYAPSAATRVRFPRPPTNSALNCVALRSGAAALRSRRAA